MFETTPVLIHGGPGAAMGGPGSTLAAGKASGYRFTITGPNDKPVTAFTVDQTKKLHFHAIRSDLTGFQHPHDHGPGRHLDRTPGALAPGSWRLFATFTPTTGTGQGHNFVLSRTISVPGMPIKQKLPTASASTTVGGYTVTVNGDLMAGMAHPLTVTITRDGKPVTDLQPYLDSYAHLTAFHVGNAAFAHLHPTTQVTGDHDGPTLTFHAELAKPGNWRLFLQLQTAGTLHAAALTLHVSQRQRAGRALQSGAPARSLNGPP